jgi:hypothetical protein
MIRGDRELRALEEDVIRAAAGVEPSAGPEQAKFALRLEEVWGSCALAGAATTLAQTRALLQRGVVAGDRAFRDYLMVWSYGQASAWVQGQRPRGTGPLVTVAEIRNLHMRISAGTALVESDATPGAWRTHNARPMRRGVVPLPPSLIVSDIASLVDRFGHGPPRGGSRFLWLATFQERLERIRPFSAGSGRVARLTVNVLLTRLGLPFATIPPRATRAYREAIAHADAGNHFPLAHYLGRSVLRNLGRFTAPSDLRTLAALAGPVSEDALRKAALRGRLRHVYVGARLFSTPQWRDDYVAGRLTASDVGE